MSVKIFSAKCCQCGASLEWSGDMIPNFCNKCGAKVQVQSEVYKCPNCGEMITLFTTVCPAEASRKQDVTVLPIGEYVDGLECVGDLEGRDCDDVIEYFRAKGFTNIVIKEVKEGKKKKGLFDKLCGEVNKTDTVKSISIAGITEFDDDDKFDINSKIILHVWKE